MSDENKTILYEIWHECKIIVIHGIITGIILVFAAIFAWFSSHFLPEEFVPQVHFIDRALVLSLMCVFGSSMLLQLVLTFTIILVKIYTNLTIELNRRKQINESLGREEEIIVASKGTE